MSGDISCAVLPVAERLSQSCDVKPQTAFFHGDVRPDPGQYFLFTNNLVMGGH